MILHTFARLCPASVINLYMVRTWECSTLHVENISVKKKILHVLIVFFMSNFFYEIYNYLLASLYVLDYIKIETLS